MPRLGRTPDFTSNWRTHAMRILGIAIVGLTLSAFVLAGEAVAQSCQPGCGSQMKACVQTARTTMLACKADCRANAAPSDLGTCMHTCTTGYRSAQSACRGDMANCRASCSSVAGAFVSSTNCAGGCGQTLGTCAQGVVTNARACVKGCTSASDRLSCLEACASAARSGAQACASDFSSCLSGCGAPPPTTPSCASAEAPACGGSCPAPNQTCTAVAGGHCACVAGRP
jgi:hypothetical protein